MTDALVLSARQALIDAPPVGDEAYRRYSTELARRLTESWPSVLEANAEDIASAVRRGLPPALVERVRLDERHVTQLVELAGAVHTTLPRVTEPGPGMPVGESATLRRVPKPLGVVLMVYEARPTVTVEGALLPVAAGNAVILRGGKEIAATNAALCKVVEEALVAVGLPADLVTILDDPSRSVLRELLGRPDAIDVLVPRGSPSLIDYCRTASSIPVIASGGGVNHLYVHESADPGMAAAVTLDSKVAEPTACNTLELVLVDERAAGAYVQELVRRCEGNNSPFTIRLDSTIPAPELVDGSPCLVEPLGEHDFGREFLSPTVGVRAVSGVTEALDHIRRHGSTHTEGVVAGDSAVTTEFVNHVDAAAIVVNGSLRLHDGPTLGLGAEVSISTGRLHVRGPVTLGSLLTHTWVVEAHGMLRSTS